MAEPVVDLAPELGPEVEVTARAAPRIGLVAILCVTLGIILSVEAVVRGFFGTVSGSVGWIPYLGSVIEKPIAKIEQKIVSMLSGLEQDVDKSLAHNIHVAAALLDKLWHSLEYMAASIVLLGALGAAATFHYLIHPLERYVRVAIKRVEAFVIHPIRELQRALEAIKHEIRHVVEPSIKTVIRAVPRYIHKDLLALHKDIARAQKTATQALNEVEAIPFPEGVATWPAAVAAALPALGLDWLRCESNPFKNNPAACTLWNTFKDLLGLLGGLFAFTVFCDFWGTVEPFIGEILAPVIALASTFANGACSQRPNSWESYNIKLDTPPQRVITTTAQLT